MRTKIICLLMFNSSMAFAVENGFDVNFDNVVQVGGGCSGTIISNKFVITALHCNNYSFVTQQNKTHEINIIDKLIPQPTEDEYGVSAVSDVAILKAENNIAVSDIFYFSKQLPSMDTIQTYGYGGNNILGGVNQKVISVSKEKISLVEDKGHTVPGDSGAPYIQNGKFIGVNTNGILNHNDVWEASGYHVHGFSSFLLNSINAWHYPTIAKFTGNKTITVQSLHVNDVADSAYTDGDVTIIGGTCVGASNIKPFDTCTYNIQSNGGEGHLYLTPEESILINEQIKPTPEPEQPDSGKSGGSLGMLTLLSMLGLSLFRNKK